MPFIGTIIGGLYWNPVTPIFMLSVVTDDRTASGPVQDEPTTFLEGCFSFIDLTLLKSGAK